MAILSVEAKFVSRYGAFESEPVKAKRLFPITSGEVSERMGVSLSKTANKAVHVAKEAFSFRIGYASL